MRRSILFMLTACLAMPMTLVGCGDDAPVATSRGAGDVKRAKSKTSKGKKSAGKAGAAGADDIDLSKLPAKLRGVDWKVQDDLAQSMRETRDPFAPYIEPDDVERDGDGDAENPVIKIQSTISDTPVEALQLIAIITGGAVHKAMVTDNRGLGHIVRPGDIVGAEPPMRLVRITRNEVLFRALEVGPDEEKPKEVRKALLSQEELQELLP